MKTQIKFFIVTCIISMCASCSPTENVTCSGSDIAIYWTGFSQNDIDSSKIYSYKQDSAFDSLVDTTETITNASTLAAPSYWSSFKDGYDYRIMFLSLGKTYLITRITNAGHVHQLIKKEPYVCFNPIVSFYINDSMYRVATGTTPYNFDAPNSVMIAK